MIDKAIKTIISIWLLIAAVAIVGCDRQSDISEKMDRAEYLMCSHPDSALSILNGINPEQIGNKRNNARYALLKSMALDKNIIDTTSFDVLQPAIDYFLKDGSADDKLRTYYYQGRIYQNQGDKDSAMQSFMRGREYCGQASDTLTMANLLVAQGTIFYTTYKHADFIDVNLKAAKLYSEFGRNDYEILSLANVLEGGILSGNKNLADSILSVTQVKLRENPEFSSYFAPYMLSYAIKFGDQEDIRKSLNCYDSTDSIDDITKVNVALAYSKIGDVDNAKRFLYAVPPSSEIRTTLKFLAIEPGILEQDGDFEGALKAYREYNSTLESFHLDIFSHDLLFAKDRYDLEKSNLMTLRKRDRYIWLSVCVAFALLIIAGYIYYRYRLSKAKILLEEQENERLQLEQDNLRRKNENLELRNNQTELEKQNLQKDNEKLELERHNADLAKQKAELEKQNLQKDNEKLELERHNAILEKQTAEMECERQSLVAENLRLKIAQLEDESSSLKEILEKRKDLAKPIEEAIKIRIEMLNGLLATKITENESYAKPYGAWRDRLTKDKDAFMNTTRLAFKASHPRFIEYLEAHGLTDSEINYVCLYAIGLRGKEAGKYMQLRRHYHISSEIRRKLGIDEHQNNLGIYIRKLMKEL